MKKIVSLLLAAAMLLSLCACGGDGGGADVTLNIPADFLDAGLTQEMLDKDVKDNGYKSATLNDDGTVTYVMSEAKHAELMKEIAQTIDDSMKEMVDSGSYPAVVSVTANDSYTQFTVTLNTEEVGVAESFASLGLILVGGMYQVFEGKEESGTITVQYVNEATGAVIDEVSSDDMG